MLLYNFKILEFVGMVYFIVLFLVVFKTKIRMSKYKFNVFHRRVANYHSL